MRKYHCYFVALALALLVQVPNSAKAQSSTVWRGVAQITAANAQCNASGWNVGNSFVFVLRPRSRPDNNLVNNGPNSYLNFVNFHKANAYKFGNSDMIAGSNPRKIPAFGTSSRGGWFSWTPFVQNSRTVPRIIQQNTDTVSIEVTIIDFDAVPGCTATLRGAGTRR